MVSGLQVGHCCGVGRRSCLQGERAVACGRARGGHTAGLLPACQLPGSILQQVGAGLLPWLEHGCQQGRQCCIERGCSCSQSPLQSAHATLLTGRRLTDAAQPKHRGRQQEQVCQGPPPRGPHHILRGAACCGGGNGDCCQQARGLVQVGQVADRHRHAQRGQAALTCRPHVSSFRLAWARKWPLRTGGLGKQGASAQPWHGSSLRSGYARGLDKTTWEALLEGCHRHRLAAAGNRCQVQRQRLSSKGRGSAGQDCVSRGPGFPAVSSLSSQGSRGQPQSAGGSTSQAGLGFCTWCCMCRPSQGQPFWAAWCPAQNGPRSAMHSGAGATPAGLQPSQAHTGDKAQDEDGLAWLRSNAGSPATLLGLVCRGAQPGHSLSPSAGARAL